MGSGSTETGIVFEGETAIDDAIDYLTGNADAEDVPSGEGETLTEFNPEVIEPSEPTEPDNTTLEDPEFPDEGLDMIDTSTLQGVLEASGLLQDIVFNEDGTYSDGDGNIYETAEELIDAINSGSGSDGTGSDAVGVGGEGEGDETGQGDGNLGDGDTDGAGEDGTGGDGLTGDGLGS